MIMGIILNFRLGDTANSRFSAGPVVHQKIITGRLGPARCSRARVGGSSPIGESPPESQALPRACGGRLSGTPYPPRFHGGPVGRVAGSLTGWSIAARWLGMALLTSPIGERARSPMPSLDSGAAPKKGITPPPWPHADDGDKSHRHLAGWARPVVLTVVADCPLRPAGGH